MTNTFQPQDSIFYNESKGDADPKIKLFTNPLQEKKKRKLIDKVKIDAPHLDKFSAPSNEKMVLTNKYKNVQMLLNDDDDILSYLVPTKERKKKKERRLHEIKGTKGVSRVFYHPKKRRHVLEGLGDLGIYDTSRFAKKHKGRFNIPIRIMSAKHKSLL